jgi:DNA-binding CsgD family transcriptional regulator
MSLGNDFNDLIDVAYEAAMDATQWQHFITLYRDRLGAECASLMHVDRRQSKMSITHDIGFDPRWEKAYQTYFVKIDPRLKFARELLDKHAVMSDEVLCRYCNFRSSEFYQAYLRPQNRVHFMGFGSVRSRDDWFTTLAVQRTEAQGPFDSDDEAFHRAIKPHVERALQIHDRIGHVTQRGYEIEAVLDQVSTGIILFDDKGRLLHANAYADRILAECDGLVSRRGFLSAGNPGDNGLLTNLLTDVLAGGPGGAMPVSRNTRRPLNVLVAPLRHVAEFARTVETRAAVFLSDPDRHPEIPAAVYKRLFGFTPAESRVADELVKGQGVKHMAARFAVTEDAIRKTLKSMFQKTDTRRQGELVALLLSSVPRHEWNGTRNVGTAGQND